MEHIKIRAICKGNKVTAISETYKVVKGYGKPIKLEFKGYFIQIKPESDVQDLVQIMMLEEKLIEATKKK